ncbi:hypothetical protein RIR_e15977_A0A2I1H9U7_9GLOM [Rhizophagus irregularis DAOM 181602=DAOM 197198]|nr:hypothetical protein RIR_e15977_A0A2I1H9U7_9GLOM [Rhizophagus irregularis DAOM 181602=DAOM 197198]
MSVTSASSSAGLEVASAVEDLSCDPLNRSGGRKVSTALLHFLFGQIAFPLTHQILFKDVST